MYCERGIPLLHKLHCQAALNFYFYLLFPYFARMSSLLIRNIGELGQIRTESSFVKGKDMQELPSLSNAWLLTEGEKIVAFGTMDNCPDRADQVIDANGGTVLPSWCDSHTHLVYAASREGEFVDRIRGLSYAEIAEKGGGILNSALRLQNTEEEVLIRTSMASYARDQGFRYRGSRDQKWLRPK